MKPESDKLLAHVKTLITKADFVKQTYLSSEQGKEVQSKLYNLLKQCQQTMDEIQSHADGGTGADSEMWPKRMEDLMFHLDVLDKVLLKVISS